MWQILATLRVLVKAIADIVSATGQAMQRVGRIGDSVIRRSAGERSHNIGRMHHVRLVADLMLTVAIGRMRWSALITSLAATLGFGWSMAAADMEQGDTLSVRPFFAVPATDPTPVEIQMQGVRWRVPRNFLESAELSDRSEDRSRRIGSASLRIVTTLSTLSGATKETLACYRALRAEVCPDAIIILTQWQAASADSWNRGAIAEAASDSRDDVFGLTKVKAQVSLGQQDVYVAYGGSPENSTVIACTRWAGRESLRDCTVRFKIGGVPLRYSFARSQLPHWQRIHAGVIATIKSFEVGDGK
jgi:hypothetical protein